MKGSLYTLAYAVVLGSICAAILTGAGEFTAPYRKANAEADETRNILGCLGVPYEPDLAPEGLLDVFARTVEPADRGGLRLYHYKHEGGAVEAVAVPFGGPGLWGPIEGFLALEPDMTTIRGITFYKQEETPGLGGEIAAASFRRRFEGKSIVDESGSGGIRILRATDAPKPTGARRANEVDGITGATMTCEKVQAMLNEAIAKVAKATSFAEATGPARSRPLKEWSLPRPPLGSGFVQPDRRCGSPAAALLPRAASPDGGGARDADAR